MPGKPSITALSSSMPCCSQRSNVQPCPLRKSPGFGFRGRERVMGRIKLDIGGQSDQFHHTRRAKYPPHPLKNFPGSGRRDRKYWATRGVAHRLGLGSVTLGMRLVAPAGSKLLRRGDGAFNLSTAPSFCGRPAAPITDAFVAVQSPPQKRQYRTRQNRPRRRHLALKGEAAHLAIGHHFRQLLPPPRQSPHPPPNPRSFEGCLADQAIGILLRLSNSGGRSKLPTTSA